MKLDIFIPGIPRPAGSKRAIPIYRGKKGEARTFTGHTVVVDTSGKKGQDWRGDIQAAVLQATDMAPLRTEPLTVYMIFYLPRPKYHYGTGKNADKLKASAPLWWQHVQTPDALKLGRAVEDALTNVLWKDDCQVRGWYEKRWASTLQGPGVKLTVQSTEELIYGPHKKQDDENQTASGQGVDPA